MSIAMIAFTHPWGIAINECNFDAMVTEMCHFLIGWSPETELIFQYMVQVDFALCLVSFKQLARHGDSSGTSATKKGVKLRVLQNVRDDHRRK